MNECEYRNIIKYGWNDDNMNIYGKALYYCSLYGERCYHGDEEDKLNCESYNKSLEYERKNHFCDDKPKDILIKLIDGYDYIEMDIEFMEKMLGIKDRNENANLQYGWYLKIFMFNPDEGYPVHKFSKIKFCPFCGEKLLI